MTQTNLWGAAAFGSPGVQAELKVHPEDFRVDEVLDIALSGEGEHLWIQLLKREANTEEVARLLAKISGLSVRAVSYAGLKDRQALSSQWFSLHLPGKTDPDFSALPSSLTLLQARRHQRKLQRGAHSANGFCIRLRHLRGDRDELEERLLQVKAQGVPNYFGLQRFGWQGNNLQQAQVWALRGGFPERRNLRSRLLSSVRSYLFNQILAQRVLEGTWNQVLPGDLLSFTSSRSFFPASQCDPTDPRLDLLDLHPTGALWGEGLPATKGEVQALEIQLAQANASFADWLAQAGLKQERRVLRLPVKELSWTYIGTTDLQLAFVLPTGCFATAVIKELVSLAEFEGR